LKVLIIGGSRHVGYGLVWRLLAGGHRVTTLNRGTRPDPFGNMVERLRVDRTTRELAGALGKREFDAAVDFAAYTGDDARGAVEALDGRVGHYVFISSGQVYLVLEEYNPPASESDYEGTVIPEPEDAAEREEWRYGVDKRSAEDVLADAWETRRFPATRLRLPMVDGERDPSGRLDAYLWRILDGGPVLLPDGGENPVRHVYAGAVVRVIAGMLGNSTTFGQAYNLAQEESPTLAELIALLAEAVGAPNRTVSVPVATMTGEGLDPVTVSPFSTHWMSVIDPARAREALDFRHEPLTVYLDRIVASWLAHPPPAPEGYASRALELELARRLSG
jgi:nucleoside-diphosphate-sugar epimerase